MPRVHKVKKSRKEFPGIPKGSTYYWWKFRYGGIRRSLTPPKSSQLTQSAHLSEAYSIQEEIEELTVDDVLGGIDLQEYADQIRQLGENAEESLYNMPDTLQEGDVGQLLQQRSYDMEDWADQMEAIDVEIDDELSEEDKGDRAQEILDEIMNASTSANIE